MIVKQCTIIHNPCFNLFILHSNSFDNQGSEINKKIFVLRFDRLCFTKTFLLLLSSYIYIYMCVCVCVWVCINLYVYICLINIQRYYICMYVCVYNIYYICDKYIQRDRDLIGSQLCIMTYTCFPHIQILSILKNCCYITDQKIIHLAQHLNASINCVSCQAGKENKTSLGQGILPLHCLFEKYISSWMQTSRIPAAVSFRFCFIHSSSLH